MSDLARRLDALRRQAGAAALARPARDGRTVDAPPRRSEDRERARHAADAATGGVARPGTRPVLPEELRRLLGIRHRAVVPAARTRGSAVDRALPGEELAPGLRYVEQRCAWPPAPAAIDACAVRGTPRPPPVPPSRAPHPVGRIEQARFLAFDTETTGLAGGTGTRAFLIGAADWHQGALRLRQLLLTTLGAETEMLRRFAAWLQPDTVLLSYNGRSYDAPLLATRYRLARLPNPLAGIAHLDLLHPVRRRWRGAWPNCRLATAERELLGVVREDDLPGSEAPRAWLDYLRGGSARDLRRVAVHNAQDLKSLGGLLCRLQALQDEAAAREPVRDLHDGPPEASRSPSGPRL